MTHGEGCPAVTALQVNPRNHQMSIVVLPEPRTTRKAARSLANDAGWQLANPVRISPIYVCGVSENLRSAPFCEDINYPAITRVRQDETAVLNLGLCQEEGGIEI